MLLHWCVNSANWVDFVLLGNQMLASFLSAELKCAHQHQHNGRAAGLVPALVLNCLQRALYW